MEDKLAELELQHTGLQDLIATLKDGKGAQKVAEWHSKMEQLRLEQLKHKRVIERQKEQVGKLFFHFCAFVPECVKWVQINLCFC